MIAQLDRDFIAASPSRSVARLVSYFLFEGRPATTRGQWVNPVVLGHLRLAARSSPTTLVDRPIFVVGMGRSGTTLLGRVLGVHPAVGFLNEPKALWHTVCPSEDLIGTYSTGAASVRLKGEHATPQVKSRAHGMLSWYLRLTRSHRVVDKYPELIFRTEFVRAIFPDAIFVAVCRRGPDAIASVVRWSNQHRSEHSDWWGIGGRKWRLFWDEMVVRDPANHAFLDEIDPTTTDDAVRAAIEWVVTMREVLLAKARLGEALAILHYEDLAKAPSPVTEELLRVCGLQPHPPVLRFADRAVRAARESVTALPTLPPVLGAAVEDTMAQLGYR